jgi:hypothetical protein
MGHQENIPVYKNGIMTTKSLLTIGFLSILTVTDVAIASDSLAAHPGQVDVLGTLHEKVTQRDSGNATERLSLSMDIIDSIGNGGS